MPVSLPLLAFSYNALFRLQPYFCILLGEVRSGSVEESAEERFPEEESEGLLPVLHLWSDWPVSPGDTP